MAGSATEAAFLEELCQEPLFAAQGNPDRNVAKQYNQLIQSDCRTLMGALRYVLWHAFGQAGHIATLVTLAGAQKRVTASIKAYGDHLWVQDPLLQPVSKLSKSLLGAMPDDYVREHCRDIEERSLVKGGVRWVRFAYEEIVAAFYWEDIIVWRFCWGDGVPGTYDAIIGCDDFFVGSSRELIGYAEKFYKGEPVSTNKDSGVRRTSAAANPMTEGPQCYVRIYDRRK